MREKPHRSLEREPPGLAELRATLALGWPLVLTNVAQNALMTSDVILMGWLGSEALAAGALGTNLYFAFLIFGIGLVSATSPLIAEELGRKRHSVREVRRTVRQGLWAAITVAVPIWIVTWNGETILLAIGQEPGLAQNAGEYMRALQWSLLPFLFYLVLRSFLAALERPGWALVIGLLAIPVNFAAAYVPDVRRVRPAGLGAVGAGIGTVISSTFMFVGARPGDRRPTGSFRRYHLFGRFWRADWPRYRTLWRIGLPIGLTLAFEVTIFNAAAMLMGRIGANELAAHAIALQIASFCFMVPLGIGQAVTVRVGRAYGAQDPDGVTRAGWTAFALGRRLHGVHGIAHAVRAPSADRRLPRPERSQERAGRRFRASRSWCSPPSSSWRTARRPSGPECCAACRIPACRCSMRPSAIGAIGLPLGVVLGLRHEPARRRHLDRPRQRPGGGGLADAVALAAPRPAGTGHRRAAGRSGSVCHLKPRAAPGRPACSCG